MPFSQQGSYFVLFCLQQKQVVPKICILVLNRKTFIPGRVDRVFDNGPGDRSSIPVRVLPKTLKMVLDTYLLNSITRYVSRVKWSNPGKGVAPSPTPRCSSYWKGRLRVALDYGHQKEKKTFIWGFSCFYYNNSF